MRLDGTRSRRWLGIPAVGAAIATLAGCATHMAPPISAQDLYQARQFKEYTVYWAGPAVAGEPLTAADNLYDFVSSNIGFAMYYGNCEGRGTFHTAGCTSELSSRIPVDSFTRSPVAMIMNCNL